ncbi:MAG: hypothetical protein JWM34_4947 [Ilumatobacteraceae bacterium]|nr:hypothetical protein [Ilumatobacteraceae bacterium]
MLIVADDLTGAADSAGAFAAAGRTAVVVLAGGTVPSLAGIDADVLSIDTDGRAMSADEAARATAAAVRSGAERTVFVKIDSTMRGHIGPTLAAALGAASTPAQRIVVCPAFPSLGRAVADGHVHVDGEPLTDGNVRTALGELATRNTLHIEDATTDADLAAVVARHHDPAAPASTVWVGSAGLARALAAAGLPTRASDVRPTRTSADSVAGATRIAVVVGSQHAASAAQVERLRTAGHPDVELFLLDPRDPYNVAPFVDAWRAADGFVLTGGATARLVLDTLGIDRFSVRGEVEIGMPCSIARSSTAATGDGPVALVTKAGGFGDDGALQRAVEFFHGAYTPMT